MITSDQIRAARAMLRWEQTELAERANVSVETIRRLEKVDGVVNAQEATLDSIRRAFETAGLEIVDGDIRSGIGSGVLRTPDIYNKYYLRIAEMASQAAKNSIESKQIDIFKGDPAVTAEDIFDGMRFIFVRYVTHLLSVGPKSSGEKTVYTTPADWFDRLKAVGGHIRIDAASMGPGGSPVGPDAMAIWNEIRGTNVERWNDVEAFLRAKAGTFVGWIDL